MAADYIKNILVTVDEGVSKTKTEVPINSLHTVKWMPGVYAGDVCQGCNCLVFACELVPISHILLVLGHLKGWIFEAKKGTLPSRSLVVVIPCSLMAPETWKTTIKTMGYIHRLDITENLIEPNAPWELKPNPTWTGGYRAVSSLARYSMQFTKYDLKDRNRLLEIYKQLDLDPRSPFFGAADRAPLKLTESYQAWFNKEYALDIEIFEKPQQAALKVDSVNYRTLRLERAFRHIKNAMEELRLARNELLGHVSPEVYAEGDEILALNKLRKIKNLCWNPKAEERVFTFVDIKFKRNHQTISNVLAIYYTKKMQLFNLMFEMLKDKEN